MTTKEQMGLELAETFNDGWDHFLKRLNFADSFMDAEAIAWMNDISIKQSQYNKEIGYEH